MSTGVELLKLLGTNPAGAAPGAAAPPNTGIDFASLLQKASTGQLSSGTPVTLAKGVDVPLSPEQLSRIAAAADQAEAQGATRALVLIDGKALSLDVSVRQITGQANLKAPGVFTGIDAVINIPGSSSASGGPAKVLPLPRSGYANPSLLRTLSRTEDAA